MTGSNRGLQSALKAVMELQSQGNKLIETAKSREHVLEFMNIYLSAINVDLTKLPPVIHIAGTKGKGSTAAMCESILRSHGYKTGLYTSPHLIDIRERIRLNGKPISEEAYLRYFWYVYDKLQESVQLELLSIPNPVNQSFPKKLAMPAFFHFLTLVAFRTFLLEELDVIIIEVGMGGRLDATNVIQTPVAVGVTTLDYDHMEVLGYTIEEIAFEKAGIFKPNVSAFSVPQKPEAKNVLENVARKVNADLHHIDVAWLKNRCLNQTLPKLSLLGSFQYTNAALAVALTDTFLRSKGKVGGNTNECLPVETLHGLANSRWSGRAQILPSKNSPKLTYYIDGAHTEASMEECISWFLTTAGSGIGKGTDGDGKASQRTDDTSIVFYCGHEKDVVALLLLLSLVKIPSSGTLYLTSVPWVRASRHTPPSAHSLIASFLEKKQLQAVIAESSKVSQESNGVSPWTVTLRDAFELVYRTPEIQKFRKEKLEMLRLKTGMELELPEELPNIKMVPSVVDVISDLDQNSKRNHDSDKRTNVLVTGSLYLVGNALESLGWSE
jgi:folylpolyglutamate synthase